MFFTRRVASPPPLSQKRDCAFFFFPPPVFAAKKIVEEDDNLTMTHVRDYERLRNAFNNFTASRPSKKRPPKTHYFSEWNHSIKLIVASHRSQSHTFSLFVCSSFRLLGTTGTLISTTAIKLSTRLRLLKAWLIFAVEFINIKVRVVKVVKRRECSHPASKSE